MVSIRGALQAALTVLGLLGVGVGVTLAQSLGPAPPGGGDVPYGFALLISWGVVDVSAGVFALGVLLLDDTGLGAFLSHRQRRVMQAGGGLLLLAALAPAVALLLAPVLVAAAGPGSPVAPGTLLSVAVVGWLALVALGVLGVGGGVLWRVAEAVRDRAASRHAA